MASNVLLGLLALASDTISEPIVHQPVACMVAGVFPLIEAAVEPPTAVVRARVYFAAAGATPDIWYFVEMTATESGLVGKLPRPKVEASPIAYYVEVVLPDSGWKRTPRLQALVVEEAWRCPDNGKVAPIGPDGEVTVFSAATGKRIEPVSGGGDGYIDTASAGFTIRAGFPQMISLMVSHVFGYDDCNWPMRGLLVAVEPGIGGGKFSLGYVRRANYGWRSAKLSLLRTWWKPAWAPNKTTYVGPEVTSSLGFNDYVIGSVGVMRRVGGRTSSRDWLVTASIGLGY